jgi:hypothetical protein
LGRCQSGGEDGESGEAAESMQHLSAPELDDPKLSVLSSLGDGKSFMGDAKGSLLDVWPTPRTEQRHAGTRVINALFLDVTEQCTGGWGNPHTLNAMHTRGGLIPASPSALRCRSYPIGERGGGLGIGSTHRAAYARTAARVGVALHWVFMAKERVEHVACISAGRWRLVDVE